MVKIYLLSFALCLHFALLGQSYMIESYIYETGNRGYLNQVSVVISDPQSGQEFCKVETDLTGHFKCDVPPLPKLKLMATKPGYKNYELLLENLKEKENNFLKIEMSRAPGYLFEITVANKRDNVDQVVDAISDYLIEVYNNTTEMEIFNLPHYQKPEFKLSLEKGNHYTILLRKEGYFAKQMEVYVNVKGCILCFDGISDVRPGVVDNLTSSNEYGVLLANVEMEKVYEGKSFQINNIFYESNSFALNDQAKKELDKVVNLLKYNPNLNVELGSFTDARGDRASNMALSEKRANEAVRYISEQGLISSSKIRAIGYGETKILNKCLDGVYCPDIDHAINRRTEIKISKVAEEWVFKPLVNLKNEEKFEKMARSGVTEELTEEQFKALNDKEKMTIAKPVEDVKQVQETDKVAVQDKKVEVSNTEIKNAPGNTETISTANQNNVSPTQEKSQILEGVKIVKGNVPAINVTDGYKIVIYEGSNKLNDNDPLLSKFNNIEMLQSGYKFLYMIPGFKSKDDAWSALTPEFIDHHPKAYVILIKDGVVE